VVISVRLMMYEAESSRKGGAKFGRCTMEHVRTVHGQDLLLGG
jgi:hypothetical protein